MDVFLLALLTTLNALFAMSEMALSTSRAHGSRPWPKRETPAPRPR
jgi:CBS domain containing-hemolysin-like protein